MAWWFPLPVPRQPGVSNNLLETFEIEQGISANEDEANDDPGKQFVPLDLDIILEGTLEAESITVYCLLLS